MAAENNGEISKLKMAKNIEEAEKRQQWRRKISNNQWRRKLSSDQNEWNGESEAKENERRRNEMASKISKNGVSEIMK